MIVTVLRRYNRSDVFHDTHGSIATIRLAACRIKFLSPIEVKSLETPHVAAFH